MLRYGTRDVENDMIGAEVKIAKRNELHKFAVIPKRWVVERSFAWLDNTTAGYGRTVKGSLTLRYR